MNVNGSNNRSVLERKVLGDIPYKKLQQCGLLNSTSLLHIAALKW
jgi:hypothetical protein